MLFFVHFPSADLDPSNLETTAKEALQIAVSNVQKTLQSSNGLANFNGLVKASSQVVAGIKYKFQISFSTLIEGDELIEKIFEVVVWAQPAGYNGPNVNYVILSVVDLDNTDSNTLNLVITGGWSNGNTNNLDEYAVNALVAAIKGVQSLFQNTIANYQKVESVQIQIVAGTNYKFVIIFDIGKFEVIVWKKLDGTFQVTQTTELKKKLGQITGGWSELDVSNLDDSAKSAANAAIGKVKGLLKDAFGQFDSILVAQIQIVAGINYKFHLAFKTTEGDAHYEVVVWKQLSGTYKVTNVQVANNLGQIAGGWSQLDVSNLDDSAKSAVNAAIGEVKGLLKSAFGEFNTISAQSQIVAGTNYKFHLAFKTTEGNVHYEVVVWKQLSGTYKVTSARVANSNLGQIAGGWAQLDVNTLDDSAKTAVSAAVGKVKGLLKSAFGQLDNILVAQSQIVAGINYKFHLAFKTTQGDVHYEVVVWKQLNGVYKVTSCLMAN